MRGGLAIAATLTAFAGPVTAEPWIDYDLLRKLHADKVVVSTDSEGKESWTLDMGDGVTVSCGGGECVGMDDGVGAVGCMFEIVAEITAMTEVCSLPIEKRVGNGRRHSTSGLVGLSLKTRCQGWNGVSCKPMRVPRLGFAGANLPAKVHPIAARYRGIRI